MTQLSHSSAQVFGRYSQWKVAALALLLGIVTLVLYHPAPRNDFILLDDPAYVTQNPHVLAGLSLEGVRWAATSFDEANWHPVTWMSHMADVQFFELEPAAHHQTNIWIHAANTVLLFLLLNRMTGTVWRSAMVAALFAFHPLNVESVAWVAERKNVLSTFFWLLALWAYVSYTRKPSLRNYLQVVVVFVLGLMSKPMLVTLPLVLLLLDYWPLGRAPIDKESPAVGGASGMRWLLVEKIPLFALAIASILITVKAQRGALASFQVWSFADRLANAAISYAAYIYRTLWPASLAIIYPFPSRPELMGWRLWASVAILVMVTGVAMWKIRARPYLAVGWFWFMGTLVPVIGIVQVGLQSSADRYVYVPLIGIFMASAWGLGDAVERAPQARTVLVVVCAVVLMAFAAKTRQQISYWSNSTSLFRHAVTVTQNNYAAHHDLGLALKGDGDNQGALQQFFMALEINPNSLKSSTNLEIGLIKEKQGDLSEAEHYFRTAASLPNNRKTLAVAHVRLANLLANKGELGGAEAEYREAIRLNPEEAYSSRLNLGVLLVKQGSFESAVEEYSRLIKETPSEASLYFLLGEAREKQGQVSRAVEAYGHALEVQPGYTPARVRLNALTPRSH